MLLFLAHAVYCVKNLAFLLCSLVYRISKISTGALECNMLHVSKLIIASECRFFRLMEV